MAQSSSVSGTSSRRHLREHDASSPGSPRYADSEWESKEAILQRELEEAKARAAQMEKTMRWWSDCTANWREKWCEVRDERNKAKNEAKVLKAKLEAAMKDLNTYKEESYELEMQNIQLKKDMGKVYMALKEGADEFHEKWLKFLDLNPQLTNAAGLDELLKVYNERYNIKISEDLSSSSLKKDSNSSKSTTKDTVEEQSTSDKDIDEYILQGAVPKHVVDTHKDSASPTQDKRHSQIDPANVVTNEITLLKKTMLNHVLQEVTKEKSLLHKGMDKLKDEIVQLRERCEELEDSRAEALKELSEIKSRLQGELNAAQADLIDEVTNREDMDQRLSDLRLELEKLQAENASEWNKRERLETEKISLERENKQLRSELRDLQDRLEARRIRPVSSCDADSKQLQQELLERNKELLELKNSHAKLKKMLSEKATELSHAIRRSEQYEAEVKRIRVRVEELKKELALVQDEVDAANNTIRKLYRTNEDLKEQLDSTNAQLEHYRNSISESRAPDVVAEIIDDITHDNDDDDESEDRNC